MMVDRLVQDGGKPGDHSETDPQTIHQYRVFLNAEFHSRPFLRLDGATRIVHFAMPNQESAALRAVLDGLYGAFNRRFDAQALDQRHGQVTDDLGPFRLRWENHTEFSTLTLWCSGTGMPLFTDVMTGCVPPGWFTRIEALSLVAIRLAFERSGPEDRGAAAWFQGEPIARTLVAGGGAEAWCDYRIYPDGYTRILLIDHGLADQQAGRLAQRLLEIETYAMMALRALPIARDAARDLPTLEAELAAITEAFGVRDGRREHKTLLARISRLAGTLEWQIADSRFRFAAARSYNQLVRQRIAELRESRIEGFVLFDEFMDRRLTPAMQLCEAMKARQEDLSDRVARTAQLLRADVELSLQDQQGEILRAMNDRARAQHKLQQVIEAFSIVAVLYYGLGLTHYLHEMFAFIGVTIDEAPIMLAVFPALLVILAVTFYRASRVPRREKPDTV